MRSWNTPALLAAMGLCGLGSLFAQNPLLPMLAVPTPVDMSVAEPTRSAPQPEIFTPSNVDPDAAAPISNDEPMAYPLSQEPVFDSSQVLDSSSSVGCIGCAASAPVAACNNCAASTPESTCKSCAAPQPVMSSPACGCQGGTGHIQMGYGQSYLMGSGSGVASGLLSPNANSGGLHTRYPYYNYRHPWYYQGPPSQNVTIVW